MFIEEVPVTISSSHFGPKSHSGMLLCYHFEVLVMILKLQTYDESLGKLFCTLMKETTELEEETSIYHFF